MNNTDTVNILQQQLDAWRAFAEQNRVDLFTLRQLISRGQSEAAGQLIGGMLESTLTVGISLDDAGANRPHTMRSRPVGADRLAAEREANE